MFNILKPTYLLPVVRAAATKLKKNGFDVIWDDGNLTLGHMMSGLKTLLI